MRFYLGAHHPHWLERASFPLFVSHRPLATRRRLPRARTACALDSGGFTELSLHGRWETTPAEYVAAVRRYCDEIGNLEWAAPQDVRALQQPYEERFDSSVRAAGFMRQWSHALT